LTYSEKIKDVIIRFIQNKSEPASLIFYFKAANRQNLTRKDDFPMDNTSRRSHLLFFLSPFLTGLLTYFLILGVMASTGCSQSQKDAGTQSGQPSGTVTQGGTGSGVLAGEKDQKLPINPQDYKPMPIPNPTTNPVLKEGVNPKELSTPSVSPQETSTQEKNEKDPGSTQ